MTFSTLARGTRTGALGAAVATSDIAVGARGIGLVHRHGAVLSQRRSDNGCAIWPWRACARATTWTQP
ncbi:MAG: putative Ntn-hydrolase superfamily protein [Paracoccaceae bacterium]|jgi:uncharacterized Ntn-hydrolase superfamily protein